MMLPIGKNKSGNRLLIPYFTVGLCILANLSFCGAARNFTTDVAGTSSLQQGFSTRSSKVREGSAGTKGKGFENAHLSLGVKAAKYERRSDTSRLSRLLLQANGGSVEYFAMSGDTLQSIADAHNTTIEAIEKLNPNITNPNSIALNERILLPAGTPSPPPVASSSPPPPPPGPAQGTVYMVKTGDTLIKIAALFNTTEAALESANPQITNPDSIGLGMNITIPPATGSPPPPAPLSIAPPPPPPAQVQGSPSSSSTNIGGIVGGVVGGVLGSAAIVGTILFFYCRHKRAVKTTAAPRSDNWERDPGPANPFQGGMTGTESAPATNVDAIFRSLQLTSLKNKANQASGARLPLMENSGDGISDGTLPADTGESNDVSSSASPPASDAHADSSMVATDLTALDAEVGKAAGVAATGSASSTWPIDRGELGGGASSACVKDKDALTEMGLEKRDNQADSWQIDSKKLQCKVKDGHPVKLGKGGSGSVYLGVLLGTTKVAIKVVDRPKDQESFKREIQLLRDCYHPNVIRFLGASIRPEKTFLVMEFCPEGDLFNAINNDKKQEFRWGKRGRGIALDIAMGLIYLHDSNIAHLDLKSPNILLARNMEAKISDIGLGKVLPAGSAAKAEGCSVWWSSPEQLCGEKCALSSDIFSFGFIMWELCTGEAPIDRKLREIRVPEEAPQAVVDLITACRTSDPTKRPNAPEVHEAIRRAMN